MSPPSAAQPPLMAHRPFALFWGARVLATIAYQMQAVAVGWQVYDLTGSALALGLIGLVQFIPAVGLALIVGHIADRYDRRTVLRLCQLTEASVAAVLAVASAGGWLSGGAILGLVFVIGAARAFELPTLHALMPTLVPPALIPRAAAASTSANQTAIIVGPALGGLIYAVGPVAVYGLCTVLFLAASTLVALIGLRRARAPREPLRLETLLAGFVYVRSRRVIMGAILFDLFAVLFGGATALLPIFARDILLTGPGGLGLLRSAPAAGALAISLWLARHPLGSHVGHLLFAAVALFGVATIVFGLSTSIVLSLAALAVLGAADALSVVIRFSLVQIETPDGMRGRVSAVNSMFIGASNTLGEFESGAAAALLGAVPAVLLGGIATLVVAFLWRRIFPELWRLERLAPTGARET